MLGETEARHGGGEEVAAGAAEHEFPFYSAAATIYRGWVLGSQDVARGIELLRAGMAAFVALGATALRPYICARIAVLSAAAGSAPDCLDLLDEALEQVDQTCQRRRSS